MARRSAYLPAEERREVTVRTVIALAAEQNPAEITTAAIAKRMGVTQGSLFRHFPSKDAIMQAVMEWVSRSLMDRIEKAVAAAPSCLGGLEAAFMTHINFIAAYPGVPRMLFGELQRSERTIAKQITHALIQHYRERLMTLFLEGKENSEFDPLLDEKAAITLFIGMVQGLAMQALLADNVDLIRENAQGVFGLFRTSIRAQI